MSAKKRVRVKVTPTPDQRDRERARRKSAARKVQGAVERRQIRAGEYRTLPEYPAPRGGYYGSGGSQNA